MPGGLVGDGGRFQRYVFEWVEMVETGADFDQPARLYRGLDVLDEQLR